MQLAENNIKKSKLNGCQMCPIVRYVILYDYISMRQGYLSDIEYLGIGNKWFWIMHTSLLLGILVQLWILQDNTNNMICLISRALF